MEQTVLNALFNNAALLLVMSVIYEVAYLVPSKYRHMQPVINGILIAAICTAIMSMSHTLRPGVIYDTRSILISVTALFFGTIPTLITVVVAVIIRLVIGGAGTLPGLAVIMASALIGLAWRRWLYPKSSKWRWLSIYAMSVIVHVIMLACMLLFPYPNNLSIIREIALPVMVIYPVASVLLSLMLIRQQDLRSTQEQLEQSEEKHRKANHNYQLLFHEMIDAFALHEIICDDQGKPVDFRFLAVNPAFERMTGLKSTNTLGKTVMEVLPDIEPFWIEKYGRVALTGEPAVFSHYSNALGKYYEVSAYQPSPNQFAVTFSDVTEQIQAKEKAMEHLSRLRGLLDNSPSPIVIIDEQGRFVEVSAEAEKIIGVPRQLSHQFQ